MYLKSLDAGRVIGGNKGNVRRRRNRTRKDKEKSEKQREKGEVGGKEERRK